MKGIAASTLMGIVEDHSRSHELRLNEALKSVYESGNRQLRIGQDLVDFLSTIAPQQFLRDPGPDTHVAQLLRTRKAEYQRLLGRLANEERAIAQALASSRALRQQRAELDHKTASGVTQSARYQQLEQKLAQTEETHRAADLHYAEVRDEYVAKLPLFEANPIFRFLRNRSYGTDNYKGGPIARQLDAWLAARVNYQTNRANELILLEMQALNEAAHNERVANLQPLKEELAALQSGAKQTIGQQALLAKQKILARQIASGKERARALHDELVPFGFNEDEHFEEGADWVYEQSRERTVEDLLIERLDAFNRLPEVESRFNTLFAEHECILEQMQRACDVRDAAIEIHGRAKALSDDLRLHLFHKSPCEESCDCRCHVECDCDDDCLCDCEEACDCDVCDCDCHKPCGCDYNYDSPEQFHEALDVKLLISSYMSEDISLDYLLKTLDAQRIASP